MTKSDDKRVPVLRFKGFTDEWEQRKLGEICKVTKLAGFEFTKYVNYSNTGSILAIRGINVKKGKFNLQDVKYIDNSNFSRLSRSKLQEGDILFTYVGTIGNSAIVPKNVNWYLAPNVCLIRPQDKNSSFISYLIQSDRFQHEEIPKWITTSSQPALSMKNIRKFKIILPLNSEQQKISSLVSKIDKLITLQQRKEKQIKLLKKAMLQTLFTTKTVPQLRFKGFTDNWEQRKLGDVLSKFDYGLNSASSDYDGKNKYLRITDIDEQTHRFNLDNLTSPKVDLKNKDNYILHPGDIVFARTGASVGKTYKYREDDGRVYFAGFLIRGRINKNFDTSFIFDTTLLPKYSNFVEITSIRSGQPGINSEEYKKYVINIPTINEQKYISKLITNLEELITLQQNKTKKLENLKQFLLQNMFI